MPTQNYNLPLITDNLVNDVARDMNALAEATDSAIKEAVDGVDLSQIEQIVQAVDGRLTQHLDESMPHKFLDNGKWYRWGFRTVNGEPQMIYEEVTA